MAFPPQTPGERTPDFRVETVERIAGLVDANAFGRAGNWLINTLLEWFASAVGWLMTRAANLAGTVIAVLVRAEDKAQPAFGMLAALAVEDVFGVKVDPNAMNDRGNRGRRTEASQAIGRALLVSLTNGNSSNGAQSLEPSAAGAENYMSVVAQMALEGWLEGWIVEACTLGQVETFGELDDIMAQVMGLGRITRSVVRPLMDARVITPFQWQVNKTYRPNLLSPSDVVRQVARGRWSREKGFEELAREGWSDERIEALLNAGRKFFSASDVRTFQYRGHWTENEALQYLAEQGYEREDAQNALRLEGLRRFDQHETSEGNALVNAYAARNIDRPTFTGLLGEAVSVPAERALLTELAELRRAVNQKQLSPAEAKACVRAGVLSVSDYRAALRDDGYTDDAVLALELLLRHELDEKATAEELRNAAAKDRAAELAKRDAARLARLAELAEERALARRGDEADLEAAAVRGLIPFARVEELYAARYDAETVAILVALLEDKRADYVEQETRAEEARQRAARRDLDVGAIEAAVLEGVLTLDQFRDRLTFLKFSAADSDVLTATLRARLAAREAALATKRAAETAARARSIDLPRFEQLVRRGVRTMAQYTALLETLGFHQAARADLVELLTLQIADDVKAREARTRAARELAERGLNLEEFRHAVVIGVQARAAYVAFLEAQRISTDRQRLLLAELDEAVSLADAARRRRASTTSDVEPRTLPIDRVRAAARLGLVSVPTYQRRLAAAGYVPDDVAIELELLLLEIADVQAARVARAAAAEPAAPKELSLEQLARAVRRGVTGIDDYRARAVALRFSAEAVETQVRVLMLERAEADAARARRAALATQTPERALPLGTLEDAVKAGLLSIDGFLAGAGELGFAADDAELLAALLLDELEE